MGRAGRRFACVLALWLLSGMAALASNETRDGIDGLPCNRFCRAWMGMGGEAPAASTRNTGTAAERHAPPRSVLSGDTAAVRPPARHPRPVARRLPLVPTTTVATPAPAPTATLAHAPAPIAPPTSAVDSAAPIEKPVAAEAPVTPVEAPRPAVTDNEPSDNAAREAAASTDTAPVVAAPASPISAPERLASVEPAVAAPFRPSEAGGEDWRIKLGIYAVIAIIIGWSIASLPAEAPVDDPSDSVDERPASPWQVMDPSAAAQAASAAFLKELQRLPGVAAPSPSFTPGKRTITLADLKPGRLQRS